ncbi:MAG TPA: phytanoyl-CoA dioxygenase family protein, partial [Flavobacterium sp.]
MKKLDCPNFILTDKITPEQASYFNQHGVIKFNNFIPQSTVKLLLEEVSLIEKKWLAEGRDKINGTPLKFGKDEKGNKSIQRFCFLSKESDMLHELLKDSRLQTLLTLLEPYEGRIGEEEKDGLVLNNYIRIPNSTFSQMGWHTDCPRDFFLGEKMMPMLNVGIHLDSCPFENGGLRVLPGTHKQNMFHLLFA